MFACTVEVWFIILTSSDKLHNFTEHISAVILCLHMGLNRSHENHTEILHKCWLYYVFVIYCFRDTELQVQVKDSSDDNEIKVTYCVIFLRLLINTCTEKVATPRSIYCHFRTSCNSFRCVSQKNLLSSVSTLFSSLQLNAYLYLVWISHSTLIVLLIFASRLMWNVLYPHSSVFLTVICFSKNT